MKTIFITKATNENGRNGHVSSEDGVLDFNIRMPETSGKFARTATNPEQLFAATYASSFASALQDVAKEHKIEDLGEFAVSAVIAFNQDRDGFFLEATLDSFLPTLDKRMGEKLIKAAHKKCPYSKATRDNITVHLNLLLEA